MGQQQRLTYQSLPEIAKSIRQRAEAIDRFHYAQANAAAERAGVGHARNVWTNAQIAYDAGKPWAEVDYAELRQAEYHDRLRYVAHQLVDRIVTRLLARLDGRTSWCMSICGPIVSWQRPYREGKIGKR